MRIDDFEALARQRRSRSILAGRCIPIADRNVGIKGKAVFDGKAIVIDTVIECKSNHTGILHHCCKAVDKLCIRVIACVAHRGIPRIRIIGKSTLVRSDVEHGGLSREVVDVLLEQRLQEIHTGDILRIERPVVACSALGRAAIVCPFRHGNTQGAHCADHGLQVARRIKHRDDSNVL